MNLRHGRLWWVVIGPTAGMSLGVVDSFVNHVPVLLGEVGKARAERGGWSQAAEFVSLVLDAGWAWAATAVLAGWLVARHVRSVPEFVRSAVTGCLALACATIAYYGADMLFDGGTWWTPVTRYWLAGSVLLGPLLGGTGALIRRRGVAGTVAALLVPAGAAAQMALLPPPPESAMTKPVQYSIGVAAAVATVAVVVRGSEGRRFPAPADEPRGHCPP